ncbi:MAG TPA: polysaccharide deacetylase family protein [Opitutaceae bacterium]|nr:polysaccharide deacetylase family protein [Opitutaceae bacterium]
MNSAAAPRSEYVCVDGRRFLLAGEPYAVCGANLWYGAHLGRPSNPAGRARLLRELDRLQALGVNNLRVLGAAERSEDPQTLHPAIQTAPGTYDEDVLQGLDYLMAEAGRREMRLVVFLNNYWDWSGGMAQYLAWATGERPVGLGRTPWPEYNAALSRFYTNDTANAFYRRYIAMLIERRNTITGRSYREEPTIMAWELANEPRPGARAGEDVFPAFCRWIEQTADYLRSLDPNHLITTGSEGSVGCADSDERFREVHALRGIDYAVFHLWPRNWSWFDPARTRETIGATLAKTRDYVLRHLAAATAIDKPLVCEEFGLDRDGGLDPVVPTTCRDRLYAEVFTLLEASRSAGGPAAGSHFWLWGGEGRPPELAGAADGVGAGDMQQEEPGRNTVFDCDETTLATIRGHFGRLRAQGLDAVPARGGLGKTAYLTIDDGPTAATGRKLDYLASRGIPAVLFCTGRALEQHRALALDAIRRGFVIANHSYGHPFFSRLTVVECCEEIRRTDAIIDALYAEAGAARPAKFFRFPYLDKGALTGSDVLATPSPEGAARKAAIQACLRELGYLVPPLAGVRWPGELGRDADWGCTYDVKEWSIAAPYAGTDVRSVEDVFARMDRYAPEESLGLNSPTGDEVILLHDHAETDEIFEAIVARLEAKGLRFVLPK